MTDEQPQPTPLPAHRIWSSALLSPLVYLTVALLIQRFYLPRRGADAVFSVSAPTVQWLQWIAAIGTVTAAGLVAASWARGPRKLETRGLIGSLALCELPVLGGFIVYLFSGQVSWVFVLGTCSMLLYAAAYPRGPVGQQGG